MVVVGVEVNGHSLTTQVFCEAGVVLVAVGEDDRFDVADRFSLQL